MRGSGDFARTIRSGSRAGADRVVVHLLSPPAGCGSPDSTLVGFVVSKAVGTAVVRTRVKRRLRHQVATRLGGLPVGSRLVVRALPPAGVALSHQLGEDLDRALTAALRKASRRRAMSAPAQAEGTS